MSEENLTEDERDTIPAPEPGCFTPGYICAGFGACRELEAIMWANAHWLAAALWSKADPIPPDAGELQNAIALSLGAPEAPSEWHYDFGSHEFKRLPAAYEIYCGCDSCLVEQPPIHVAPARIAALIERATRSARFITRRIAENAAHIHEMALANQAVIG